jgi:hypothetical protein
MVASSKTACSGILQVELNYEDYKTEVHRTMLASVMTILITSVTKGSYSVTGKACNLILLTELHFTSSTKLRRVFMHMIFYFYMEISLVTPSAPHIISYL